MKISTPGGKKQDEVPILPRYISDSITDLKDQNLDDKERVKAEIEAVGQAKLVSSTKSSPVPQPTKIVLKKKTKAREDTVCQSLCDLIGYMIYPVVIFLFGVSLGRMLVHNDANIQIDRHNSLVRFVNCLQKNQGNLYNGINDVMTKVSKLTENNNNTKEELYDVEYFINDLAKDLQNLKDSVKRIEEEMHQSDDDDDIVVDGDDQYDEASDYPVTPSHDITSTTKAIQSAESEGYYVDDMGWAEDLPVPRNLYK